MRKSQPYLAFVLAMAVAGFLSACTTATTSPSDRDQWRANDTTIRR